MTFPSLNARRDVSASATDRLLSQSKSSTSQAVDKFNQDGATFQLALKRVIGTTTCSTRGFDGVSETSTFAICAGSVAIIGTLDETANITQRFFRAKPSAVPINAVSPIYTSATSVSTSGTRNQLVSSAGDGINGLRSNGSSWGDKTEVPGKGIARQRARAATCVALSKDGRHLAVGEVLSIHIGVRLC